MSNYRNKFKIFLILLLSLDCVFATNKTQVRYDEIQVFEAHVVLMTDGLNIKTEQYNASYIAIKLSNPIDLIASKDKDDWFNVEVKDLQVMQIVPFFKDLSYEYFKTLIGQKIILIGDLYHRENGNQMTEVLFTPYQIINSKDKIIANKNELNAISNYYSAISQGNGELANKFLIPEKRNKGNYEVHSMSKFYGGLTDKLSLKRIQIKGENKFEINYTYKMNNTYCNGVSNIEMRKDGEIYLISSIKANC